MANVLLGLDVGGTFTDALALDLETARRVEAKAPTTPEALPDGVVHAAQRALARLEAQPDEVVRVVHGTTTATNALLEDALARTALVTNEGFEDVLEIGRQDRPSLYDLDATGPGPVVPRALRFGVGGRLDATGQELEPVDEDALDPLAASLEDAGVDAVAVGLLHAHREPGHEEAVADGLRERLPDRVRVAASHEVSAEVREVERFTTTVVNAALEPRMAAYLDRLTDRLAQAGLAAPVSVLDSAGARIQPAEAARLPVRLVLSGPAGGVASMAWLARETGRASLIGVDMGGTSTDVSLVVDGEPTQRWETEVAGRRLQIPAADVHTVGAGGGSVAWLDDAGGLRVGPASAGAEPGPACYGRGGEQATLTDANLVLGRLPAEVELGGELALDHDAAQTAVARIAERLDETPQATAAAIVRIATAHAVRGIRVLAARHAADPARSTLVAFGGAGPQFGVAWATRLGIDTVLVPRHAGVRSAAGLLAAPPRVERARSLVQPLPSLDRDALEAAMAPLAEAAHEALGQAARAVQHRVSARYAGQSHELTVAVDTLAPDRIREAFEAAHEAHHGYRLDDADVEVVTLRARAVADPELPETRPGETDRKQDAPVVDRQRTVFAGASQAVSTAVVDGDGLAPGHRIDGPAIVTGRDTTVLVPPAWRGRVTPHHHLVLEQEGVP